MLASGRELCRPRTASYMRLDRTCPSYHLSWDEGDEDALLTMESSVPQEGRRDAILDAVKVRREGGKYAMHAIKNAKAITSRNAHKSPLYVHPG
ncbi:unnamed protein product [Sphacelaria rigidula]